MLRARTPVIAALTLLVGAATGVAGAAAAPRGDVGRDVGSVPASFTPWLLRSTPNQRVMELAQCGGTMYAVGTISAVGQGTQTYSRSNVFSFSATTGAVTTWSPQVSGTVRAIALSPDCRTAYLGGSFSSVNGTAAANLVAVDAVTGAVLTGFGHSANNEVDTLVYTAGRLLVGGKFTTINGTARTRFASLDPVSGVVTAYADLTITGTYPEVTTKVYNAQLSHSGTKLLIEGVFTSIAGQARQQVAMLDLGATSVTVDPWFSLEFDQSCVPNESFYAQSAAWSPDDGTVYVATTGYLPASGAGSSPSDPRAGLCDAAAAFPASPGLVTHLWVDYTGCDSYYAVAADAGNVYVAGHERWADNPLGCDAAGPGAVSRPGVGSLVPATGQATAWDPTRARGYGASDLLITSGGLWIGSDNFRDGSAQQCGGVGNKGGICFLPN